MRNHVSKVLVGSGIDFKDILTLAEGEIVMFDWHTKLVVDPAVTSFFGFARGTTDPEKPYISGPFGVTDTQGYSTAYAALDREAHTLTVVEVPEVNTAPRFKVIYDNEFGLAPNRTMQTTAGVLSMVGDTPETYAKRVAETFEAKKLEAGGKFFTATNTGATVVFVPEIPDTLSKPYNRVDRPEVVYIEVGVPQFGGGKYTVEAGSENGGVGVPPTNPHGTPGQIQWMEDMYQGRFGHTDRICWPDEHRRYQLQAIEGKEYSTTVLRSETIREGDMQNVRHNPTGVILALDGDTVSSFNDNLSVIVPITDISPSGEVVPIPEITFNATLTITGTAVLSMTGPALQYKIDDGELLDYGPDGLLSIKATTKIELFGYKVMFFKFVTGPVTAIHIEKLSPEMRSLSSAFRSLTTLTSFTVSSPEVTSSISNFSSTWYGCSSLLEFPLIDTSSGTDFSATWSKCSSLVSFPILDVSRSEAFEHTWSECSSLTTFPALDMSGSDDFFNTWAGCSSLVSFPALNNIEAKSFLNTWKDCTSLVCILELDFSSSSGFLSTFSNCPLLVQPPTTGSTVREGVNGLAGTWTNPGACP